MKRRRMGSWAGFLLVYTVAMSLAIAGSTYRVTCPNGNCHFRGDVNFGGGRAADMLTGFCTKCGKFVYLSWNREEARPAPAFVLWDAKTGQSLEVFKCPDCGTPFLPIASVEALVCCPKCNQPSLDKRRTILYD